MAEGLRPLLLLFTLLCSLPLSAHNLKIFAMAEGVTIRGQAYFVGGAPARGAKILITDTAGNVLARLTPDETGHFEYRIASAMDYQVVADTLDGHRVSWTLRADEFSFGLPAGEVQPGSDDPQGTQQPASAPARTETRGEARDKCKQAVAHQVGPLRERLLACEGQLRLRDILGGLGYIVGLAGLGLWWGGRRRGNRI